ncbi:MAG: protein kinase [Archangium sp.]|nr:protein kinase [Archangium sp.]
MKCLDENLLLDLAEGAPGPATLAEVEQHLDTCEACRRAVAGVMRLSQTELTRNEPPPLAPAALIGGRYEVLGPLGSGAMGVVYEAHDRQLDRKVALKFLRQARGAAVDDLAQRMLREARALARINHPNVVVVHDSGLHEGRVYLVMELVRGATLTAWQAGRPWRAVLDAYLQAGAGLAAAHGAGVVHRDFKPDNVLVSDDGRVRVSDFGIARLDDAPGPPEASRGTPPAEPDPAPGAAPLTFHGALVGTPAYMSPEQFAGRASDARSDQFAFCVALFEALSGTRPFEGETLAGLRDNVSRGGSKRLPPTFPRRLDAALRRGLQADPRLRWPDLGALLAQLELVRRPRRAWLVAAALVVAVSAVAAPALVQRASLCTGAAGRVEGAWNDAVRAEVQRAFAATGSVLADPSFERAAALADDYRAAWERTATETCEATRLRGEQPEALHTARTICLEHQLELFAATTRLWRHADRNVVVEAVKTIRVLPRPADCSVEAARLSGSQLPADPQARERIAGLRLEVSAALPLSAAARHAEARALLTPLGSPVAATGWQPLLAEHALALARAHLGESHLAEAEASALDAVDAAERSADPELTARARLALSEIVGVRRLRADDGPRLFRSSAVAIEKAGQPLALQAALAEQRADFAMGLGRVPEARAAFREALALRERAAGPKDVSLAQPLLGLARVALTQLALEPGWEQHLARALELQRAAYGARHPEVARTLRYRAALLGRHQKGGAVAQAREAIEMVEQTAGESLELGFALSSLGQLLLEEQQVAEARASLLRALTLLRRFLEADHPTILLTLMNLSGSASWAGQPAEAFALMEELLPLAESRLGRNSGKWALHFVNWCASGSAAGRADLVIDRCTAEPARIEALLPDDARIPWKRILGIVSLKARRFPEARRLLEEVRLSDDAGEQRTAEVYLRMADVEEGREVAAARAWLVRRAAALATGGALDQLLGKEIHQFLSRPAPPKASP